MRAISTRYAGPTDTRGSRIIATDGNGHRLSVGYDDARNSVDNHRTAAQALSDRLPPEAPGTWHWRSYTHGDAVIWVLAPGNGF